MPVKDIVLAFIDAINAHDVEQIVGMCSADHQFVDAYGSAVATPQLRAAWSGYFAFMPRYGIEVQHVLCESDCAAVFGFAWGSLDASREWRRPAAWQARIDRGQIQLWQVYVDTKAVFDLLTPKVPPAVPE